MIFFRGCALEDEMVLGRVCCSTYVWKEICIYLLKLNSIKHNGEFSNGNEFYKGNIIGIIKSRSTCIVGNYLEIVLTSIQQ
jgi:hypothetical protein